MNRALSLRLGRPRDWLIGVLLLVALLVTVELAVGWSTLLAPWSSFPPLTLIWLVSLLALSYVLRAVRVYEYYVRRLEERFVLVLRLSVLHNVANNLLPMRAGELVFPWLMRRYFGHDFLGAAFSLVWIRVLDLHFLGLIGLWILSLRHPSWIWWGLAGCWLAMLVALAWVGRGGARWSPRSRPGRALARVAEAAPRDLGVVVRVYLWTAASWSLKFAAFAGVLQHFMAVDFWRVLAGVMGAELSSVLPLHGIAGSGSYEFAAVAALVPLGVDPRLALSGAVNLHLFLLGSTLLFGALALLLPRASIDEND
ncbi:membrane protein [Marichromatium purpuratum 984]|uniref:Membrane protein n=1 Tax=Marichromatium purpuratum 984 TaxID=765910 RepID=W0E005_MARPU|nr:lysylphosphatidylglycerol synthase transmembrane domain-containing protein [Marichromatium purpuratum]AHF02853.1 membrane protein [Marichromatium purpuratum 984]